ncbi:MAG: hypothetical protein H0U77_09220, partial [Nocardioidaceae bacterium]|nr:hypothetical protein [Nocardioidaceae bacterium]
MVQPRGADRATTSRGSRGTYRVGVAVVLGIETSCDETGVGLVADGVLLGDALASSVDEHVRFGGVIPEIAARAHLEALGPTVDAALADAGLA